MTPSSSLDADLSPIFKAFEKYSFADDPDFRAGLPTILNAIKSTKKENGASGAAGIDEMISRAQWFYFTRINGLSIPWDQYKSYHTQTAARQNLNENDNKPSSSSFLNNDLRFTNLAAQTHTQIPVDSTHSRTTNRYHNDISIPEDGQSSKLTDTTWNEVKMPDGEVTDFASITKMIIEGRASEVPVKLIPEGVNDEPPSESTMSLRPKPWEIRS